MSREKDNAKIEQHAQKYDTNEVFFIQIELLEKILLELEKFNSKP